MSDTQKHELSSILGNYQDLFNKKTILAKVDGHAIRVTAECSSKRLSPYRIPINLQKVEHQISELLEQWLIETSYSDLAHPMVFVAKKDGTIRLCADFWHMNNFTITDAYPMKIAKDLLHEIFQTFFFTILDIIKGWWQIPMEDESKPLTAFVTFSKYY